MQNKKLVLKEICNITIFIILTLKVLQKFIYLGFVERQKFQIVFIYLFIFHQSWQRQT